jgi:ABC-type Fe3+-siderophore transport system permease subunit
MRRIWANYAAKYTTGVIKSPSAVAFGVVMFAFVAGNERDHPVFASLFLLYAVLTGYFLARAVRQLRNGRQFRDEMRPDGEPNAQFPTS